ncbi:MAG: hypothetical protein JWP79_1285 [Polaromonas sp.]|jgi:hypothetical protein|nr:hypothetical protein [Polaromonas sp.]
MWYRIRALPVVKAMRGAGGRYPGYALGKRLRASDLDDIAFRGEGTAKKSPRTHAQYWFKLRGFTDSQSNFNMGLALRMPAVGHVAWNWGFVA